MTRWWKRLGRTDPSRYVEVRLVAPQESYICTFDGARDDDNAQWFYTKGSLALQTLGRVRGAVVSDDGDGLTFTATLILGHGNLTSDDIYLTLKEELTEDTSISLEISSDLLLREELV